MSCVHTTLHVITIMSQKAEIVSMNCFMNVSGFCCMLRRRRKAVYWQMAKWSCIL